LLIYDWLIINSYKMKIMIGGGVVRMQTALLGGHALSVIKVWL